ncbi:MAG TPA: DUF2279 domain-containing protein, partial [Cryomorphaceae bacterium]|nr:DUF2279 domain-containing protein [Cryomorphaceae bacterium]
LNRDRLWLVGGVGAIGYSTAVVGLNELWYNDFPRSDFHFFNDNRAWMQMDKAGHALTSYQLGRLGYESLKWAGVKDGAAVWIGGNLGTVFLTTVEVFDGYSKEWGFSTGDFAANIAGTSLFIAQELGWGEQRIALKFSYSPSSFQQYRPETLGNTGAERIFKDYNGQTIWISVNPSRFNRSGDGFLPSWLNLAFGYSANGMLGGDENPEFNSEGVGLPQFDRYRQYLFSLDVDLSQIKTRSHFLKTLFSMVGFIKIPAPAIEFSQGNVRFHGLYF